MIDRIPTKKKKKKKELNGNQKKEKRSELLSPFLDSSLSTQPLDFLHFHAPCVVFSPAFFSCGQL